MADVETLPSLPPRNTNPFRSMEAPDDTKVCNDDPNQTTWTPAALYAQFQAPPSDHVHDFRQCYAFALSGNQEADHLVELAQDDAPPAQWSSRFLCHICHTWLYITSSAYRHTCPTHPTHHYHPTASTAAAQPYQCCGCEDHVQLNYHDPIISANLLLELSSTRALIRTYLDTTQQSALRPTVHSTLSTLQKYISDLLENKRRNINTQNPHFIERIGLDDIT